ncbi:MAG TPA: MFS transporter [Candidatus Limnocylindria bacterium]|jgi:MFS family permease
MTRRGKLLGALSEPQFRLLWIGQTTSAFGDGLTFLAIAFAVLHIGGKATDLGLVFAAFFAAYVSFVLVGGVWADRLPRQLVMVAADLVRGVVQVIIGLLLLTGEAHVWQIAIGVAVYGAASAFFQPASTGLVPQTVSAGRLQQANALMSISRNGGSILGPPVSGLIVAFAGTGAVFMIDAATFGISAISLLLLRPVERTAPEVRQPFLAELAGGWREVLARPWIAAALVAFGISNASGAAFFILGPVIADAQLGGAAAWGLVLTGGAIGGVLGGLLALRIRPRRPLLVGFAVMSLIALQPLSLVGPAPVLLIAGAFLLGFGAGELTNTWWFTMLQQHVPEHARSRVSSYDWLVSFIFQPLGFLAVGPLSQAIGPTATLVGAASLILLADITVTLLPSIRSVTWVPEEAATGDT